VSVSLVEFLVSISNLTTPLNVNVETVRIGGRSFHLRTISYVSGQTVVSETKGPFIDRSTDSLTHSLARRGRRNGLPVRYYSGDHRNQHRSLRWRHACCMHRQQWRRPRPRSIHTTCFREVSIDRACLQIIINTTGINRSSRP
jgi:hypothetical protein